MCMESVRLPVLHIYIYIYLFIYISKYTDVHERVFKFQLYSVIT